MESFRVNLTELRQSCVLSKWNGAESCCQWCNQSLVSDGRRKVFCSSKCSLAFERNHLWNRARSSAKRRDKYSCRECGAHKSEVKIEVDHVRPLASDAQTTYSTPSCFHHQDNLKTLCRKHHLEKTALEAAERAATRRDNKR